MGFLISSYWVLAEARTQGIEMTEGEARRAFDRIRGRQFHRRGEFRRFLRQSRQTIADLLFRVRLNILSQRIQKKVTAHLKGPAAQRALATFVRGFRLRWTEQTYCEPAFAGPDCGHVQASL